MLGIDNIFTMLERISIGFLTTTLFAYLGVVGTRYLAGKQSLDWTLALLVFATLLRTKIGLDDIHYFSARHRKSKPADSAIAVTFVAYVLWFLLPFEIVRDFRTGLVVNSVTIILSTASVALTGMDLDNQLREASRGALAGAAKKYAELQRFYDEQPRWIINNCMYEAGLLTLVYLHPASNALTAVVFSILVLLVVRDAVQSGAVAYISGSRLVGAAIHCGVCNAYLGTAERAHKFCPTCGTSAVSKSLTEMPLKSAMVSALSDEQGPVDPSNPAAG